jgi:hypothetical protein
MTYYSINRTKKISDKKRDGTTTVLPYRTSGLFRHRDVDQEVCFPEAPDQVTGACVSHREDMITDQSKKNG